MPDKIQAFKEHVTELSANPAFLHHKWFAQWHLQIVEKISLELCDYYPEADRELVEVVAWLHDYGKILDYDNERDRVLLDKGRDQLIFLGFNSEFANKAADYVEWLDKHSILDLHEAPIEAQIVSSADGCSHITGIFMHVFWNFETDKTFADRTLEELMVGNLGKARKDWERKIVVLEARKAFEVRHKYMLELSGQLPERFIQD